MDDLEKQLQEDRENYLRSKEHHQDHHDQAEETVERPREREVASSISPAYRVNRVYQEPVEEVVENRATNKAVQIVYYITGILIALVGLRFLLLLFGASNTGFVNFIYELTEPIVAPFKAIFANVSVAGTAVLEIASLFAILVLLILGYIIAGLFRVLSRDTTPV